MNIPIAHHWEFDFQGKYEVDIPRDQKPFWAIAGGLLHNEFSVRLIELFNQEHAARLRSHHDYRTSRDSGYSIA